MKFSARIQDIETSATVQLSGLIQKLKASGENIIGLNVGEPDFSTPDEIKQATIRAIEKDQTKYDHVCGVEELRCKIAKSLGTDAIPLTAKNVLIANGSKQIIYTALQTLCDPGDEVIILRPYWVTFPESVKLAGAKPIFVETKKNHQLDLEKIENAITKKTKAIIINTPNNPSGAVYPKEDLFKIGALILKYKLFLLSDEAYDKIIYGENKHFSLGFQSQELFARTITIKTFSKTFCMTGFRIGYMLASIDFIEAASKLHSHLTGNNCTFAQYGAIAAMDLDSRITDKMISNFQVRSELAYSLFKTLFPCEKPQGAFYLYCDVRTYLGDKFKDDNEFCLYLLEKAKVALVPGVGFGGSGFMRISFAQSEENIEEAFKRIKAAL